jgi:uracil-DNA glycosylase family 4
MAFFRPRKQLPPAHTDVLVQGTGPQPCRLMAVAGGASEDDGRYFRALCGRSGNLFDDLLKTISLGRDRIRVDHVYPYWTGPDTPEPSPRQLRSTRDHVLEQIRLTDPEVILALGRTATRWFCGDVDLDAAHGIPHSWNGRTVLPTYQPSACFFSPDAAACVYYDLHVFKTVARSGASVVHREEPTRTQTVSRRPVRPLHLGIDTEGTIDKPICLTWSDGPGRAGIVYAEAARELKLEAGELIFHSALHDLAVLKRMGVQLSGRIQDSMQAAYLLGVEPQALKQLSKRWLRENMTEFLELVRPYYSRAMHEYLLSAAKRQWAVPEARPARDNPASSWRLYTPWGLNKRIASMLRGYEKDPKRYSLQKAWNDTPEDVRAEAVAWKQPPEMTLNLVPREQAEAYALKDAEVTPRVFRILYKRLVDLELERAYEVDMAFLPLAGLMQEIGMHIDLDRVETLRVRLKQMLWRTLRDLRKLGHKVNPQSGDQVAVVITALYQGKVKMTDSKKRITTDDDTLKGIRNESVDEELREFIRLVLEYRAALKTLTTFVEPLPAFTAYDGRVHPKLRTTRTATGRLSSAEPNLMAFPIHSELGRLVRGCFTATPGYRMVSIDYSQIELRIMAHESGDWRLIDAYKKGLDLHRLTAARFFGVKPEAVTTPQRDAGKTGNFKFMYGISAREAYNQGRALNLPYNEAAWERLIREWFAYYSDVDRYLRLKHQEARRYGYVRDWIGRIRWTPLVHSRDEYTRAEAERQAGNFPIQAGAGEVLKVGGGRIYPLVKDQRRFIRPLLPIHDDLTWEIREDRVDYWVPILEHEMTRDFGFKVSVKVDSKMGDDWAALKG